MTISPVQHLRQEALVKAKATVRFETAPGRQLQIDFGSTKMMIEAREVKIFLFVATLGYSRRIYVAPFLHERQEVWIKGIEGAFAHFGGITEEVLLDNAKALVLSHNPLMKDVVFNMRFKAFSSLRVRPGILPFEIRGKCQFLAHVFLRNTINNNNSFKRM